MNEQLYEYIFRNPAGDVECRLVTSSLNSHGIRSGRTRRFSPKKSRGTIYYYKRFNMNIYIYLSNLSFLYIGRVHGEISGCTVLGEVHPVSAQNKGLISDTLYGYGPFDLDLVHVSLHKKVLTHKNVSTSINIKMVLILFLNVNIMLLKH